MELTEALLSKLPRRPRLLPGLAMVKRGGGEVQIGMDPRFAVVVGGVSEHLLKLLSALNGEHTVVELLDQLAPSEIVRTRALELLVQLTDAGMLDDAAPADGAGIGAPARLSADSTMWTLRTGEP